MKKTINELKVKRFNRFIDELMRDMIVSKMNKPDFWTDDKLKKFVESVTESYLFFENETFFHKLTIQEKISLCVKASTYATKVSTRTLSSIYQLKVVSDLPNASFKEIKLDLVDSYAEYLEKNDHV